MTSPPHPCYGQDEEIREEGNSFYQLMYPDLLE